MYSQGHELDIQVLLQSNMFSETFNRLVGEYLMQTENSFIDETKWQVSSTVINIKYIIFM